jgi:hypothetical protein
MDPVRSHYQRLGVTPDATTDEIRSAYRALAARLHPDRQGDADDHDRAFAERRMREINESWHVLQDPARRLAYDRDRRARANGTRPAAASTSASTSAASRADVSRDGVEGGHDLVDVLPPMTAAQAGVFRHLPWVVALLVLGLIFVVSAYANHEPDTTPAARVPTVGECIDVTSGPSTTIVGCDGPHEFEIVARVDDVGSCPAGTEPRRLGRDGRFDCLRS